MSANEFAYQKLCSLFYDASKQFASEQELGFYLQFVNKTPGRILEAMTGTGRIQIPLIRMGYEIDGVDRSEIMLERCRLRSKEFGLTPNLYQQSLEELNLPHQYQTIIAYATRGHLADRYLYPIQHPKPRV
jgi:2-polyprenyl-3-methyl-5-hydroxy-6-metoxy-1,4-benzoquinol methylase